MDNVLFTKKNVLGIMVKMIVVVAVTCLTLIFLFPINSCSNDRESDSARIIGQWRSEPTLGQLGRTILTLFFGENGDYWESIEFIDANRIPTVVARGTYKVNGNSIVMVVSGEADEVSPITITSGNVSFYFEGDELVLVEENGDSFRLKKMSDPKYYKRNKPDGVN